MFERSPRRLELRGKGTPLEADRRAVGERLEEGATHGTTLSCRTPRETQVLREQPPGSSKNKVMGLTARSPIRRSPRRRPAQRRGRRLGRRRGLFLHRTARLALALSSTPCRGARVQLATSGRRGGVEALRWKRASATARRRMAPRARRRAPARLPRRAGGTCRSRPRRAAIVVEPRRRGLRVEHRRRRELPSDAGSESAKSLDRTLRVRASHALSQAEHGTQVSVPVAVRGAKHSNAVASSAAVVAVQDLALAERLERMTVSSKSAREARPGTRAPVSRKSLVRRSAAVSPKTEQPLVGFVSNDARVVRRAANCRRGQIGPEDVAGGLYLGFDGLRLMRSGHGRAIGPNPPWQKMSPRPWSRRRRAASLAPHWL